MPCVARRYKVGFDRLLEYMAMTTGLSASDLRSVFLRFAEALAFFLTEGSEVQTAIGAMNDTSQLRGMDPSSELTNPGAELRGMDPLANQRMSFIAVIAVAAITTILNGLSFILLMT